MSNWKPEKLRAYPHLDQWVTVKDAIALATNPARVEKHSFYPFIQYTTRWNRFAAKGGSGKTKTRLIRYASRNDSYIYARYRDLLSFEYEKMLSAAGLGDTVIAYRKIKGSDGRGKCNIDFARDAFEKIKTLGDCCVVALDISSFFECLDHMHLKEMWCRLLSAPKLPNDHFQVFRSITSYSTVDRTRLYERLGLSGPIAKLPTQLCTGNEFRKKIVTDSTRTSLIERNFKNYGIPQGSPISDLLANAYLFDFDCSIKKQVSSLNGTYYRYSDDILIVVPGGEAIGRSLMASVQAEISKFGKKLKIKDEKSSIVVYSDDGTRQHARLAFGSQGRNGIEYLGFRYDGRRAYIRDSTISNLYRKIARAAKARAISAVRRFPNKNSAFIKSVIDKEGFIQRFGRVHNFGELHDDYRNWTFWTYARRASKNFGALGSPIDRQLRSFRSFAAARLEAEIDKVSS